MSISPELRIQALNLSPTAVQKLVIVTPPELFVDAATGRVDQVIVGANVDGQESPVPLGKVTTEPKRTSEKDRFEREAIGTSYAVTGFVGETLLFEGVTSHAYRGANSYLYTYSPEQLRERKTALQVRAAKAVFYHLGVIFPVPGRSAMRPQSYTKRQYNAIAAYLASGEAVQTATAHSE